MIKSSHLFGYHAAAGVVARSANLFSTQVHAQRLTRVGRCVHDLYFSVNCLGIKKSVETSHRPRNVVDCQKPFNMASKLGVLLLAWAPIVSSFGLGHRLIAEIRVSL